MKRIFQLTQKIGTWLSKDSKESASPLLLQSLEDRILYSAVPLPVENVDVPAETTDLDQVELPNIESNTTFVFADDDAEETTADFPATAFDVNASYFAADDVEASLDDIEQLVNSLEESDDTSSANQELRTAAGIASATPDEGTSNFFTFEEGQSFVINADFLSNRSSLYPFGFTLESLPTNGTILNDGEAVQIGDDVSRSAINDGEVIFVPETSFVGDLEFSISGNGPFGIVDDTFSIRYDGVADDGIVIIGETFAPTDGSAPLFDTTNGVAETHITSLNDGGYVVVSVLDDNEGDLKFQRFDNGGIPVGSEVVIDSEHSDVENVDVTSLSDGGFLVAFEGEDTSKHLNIQRYDSDGQAVTFADGTTQISPLGTTDTESVSIEFLGEEFFTVTYVHENNSSITNILYNLDGTVERTQTLMVGSNFSRESIQTELLGDGSYVVAWVEVENVASDASKIKAAIFDPGGHSRIDEVEIFAGTDIANISIAATPETGFVATWQGTNSDPAGIYAAKFDTLGNPVGSTAFVAQGSIATEARPDIVALADGSFVISYTTIDEDGTEEIQGHRLNENFARTGAEFEVNSFSQGDQSNSELALLNDGSLVSTFTSTDADGSTTILHQRFSMAAIGDEDTLIPLTNVIGIDGSSPTEVIKLIEVSGLPVGSKITTGEVDLEGELIFLEVFTSADTLIFNDADISELSFMAPEDASGTYEATIRLTTNDGGDEETIETNFQIAVNPVVDIVINNDTTITTDEDTRLILSPAQFIANFGTDGQLPNDLVNSISNVDFTDVNFEDQVQWSPSPTSGIASSYLFDGTQRLTANLSGINEAASFEFWIRPETLVGNDSVIAQFGDATEGFTVLQNQDEVILRFKADGSDTFELRADGLVGQLQTGSYDQVVVTFGTSAADPNKLDAAIYLNGDLAESITDLETVQIGDIWNADINLNLGQSGSGGGVGAATATNFGGELGLFRFENSTLDADDVQQRFEAITNAPRITSINGTTIAPGASIEFISKENSIPSTLTVDQDGSLIFEPQSQDGSFNQLRAGDLETIEFEVEVQTGTQSFTNTSNFNVEGLNDLPIQQLNEVTVNRTAGLSTLSLENFVIEVDGTTTDPTNEPTNFFLTTSTNGLNVFFDTALDEYVLTVDPQFFLTSDSIVVPITVSDGDTFEQVNFDLTVNFTGNQTISGTVAHDVDIDGSIAGDDGFDQARVLLYSTPVGTTDFNNSADFVAETLTDSEGRFVFDQGIDLNKSYFVVVDSLTVLLDVNDLHLTWAQQTYASQGAIFSSAGTLSTTAENGYLIGGKNSELSDIFTNTNDLADAQHVIAVASAGNVNELEFGFNFDVVNVVSDEDQFHDPSISSIDSQGSLRQFIQNSNVIDGINRMVFLPTTAATEFNAAGDQWWKIEIEEKLSSITDDFTIIDGNAYQTSDTGLIRYDLNSGIVQGTFGGQTVGIDGDRIGSSDLLLDEISAPDLEITVAEFDSDGNAVGDISSGFTVSGISSNRDVEGVEIRNISIHGFGDGDANSGNIVFDGNDRSRVFNVSDFTLSGSVIGARPDFTQFSAGHNQSNNIVVVGVTGAETEIDTDSGEQLFSNVIENNLIANADLRGIYITSGDSTANYGDNTSGLVIRNNQVSFNGLTQTENGDGIEINNHSTEILVLGNYIAENHAIGIDTNLSLGSNTILRNTIENNRFEGFSSIVQTGGIRLSGIGNTVSENTIQDNAGAGVHVVGEFLNDGISGPSFFNVILSNEFSNNDGPAIDNSRPLLVNESSSDFDDYSQLFFDNGDGNDVNDQAYDDATGNFGIDTPEITSAIYDGNDLIITFSSNVTLLGTPLDVIEVYLTENGAAYGEGNVLLGQIRGTELIFEDGEIFARLTPPAGDFALFPSQPLSINATISSLSFVDIDDGEGNTTSTAGVNTSEFSQGVEVEFNSAPIISPNQNQQSVVEGNTLVGTIDATDSENDALTYSIAGNDDAARFTIDNNGALSFVTAPDFDSRASFDGDNFYEVTVQVTDEHRAFNTIDLTVEVTNRNEAPTFDSNLTFPLFEGDEFSQRITAVDPDGDFLRYSKVDGVGDADLFQVTTSGTVNFTAPQFDPAGDNTYELRIKALDQNGEFATADITFVVSDVNEAPVFDDIDPIDLFEGDEFSERITATDPNGDTLTYSKVNAAGDADLFQVTTSGTIIFTAPEFIPDGDNTYELRLKATDGDGESAITNISFVVSDVNEAPVFDDIDPINVFERDQFSERITATDPNGDTLTYSKVDGVGDSDLFQVTTSGTINFTAPEFIPDGDNTYELRLKVTDEDGESALTDINVTVENVNDRPSITNAIVTQNFEVEEIDAGQGVDLSQLSTFDADGDTLTLVRDGNNNDNELFRIIDNQLVFVTTPDLSGGQQAQYEVSIVASDGRLNSRPSIVSIVVNNQNDAPLITTVPTGPVEVQQNDDSLIYEFEATDRDGDNVTFTIAGGANQDSFQITSDGRLSLVDSNALFENIDTSQSLEVQVRASDGLAASARTITVVLEPEVSESVSSQVNVSNISNVRNNGSQGNDAPGEPANNQDNSSSQNGENNGPAAPTDSNSGINTSTLSTQEPAVEANTQTEVARPIDINGLAAIADLNLSDDETFFDLTSDSVAYLSQSDAQGPQLITQELGDIIEARRTGEDVGLDKSLLAKYFWQGFDDSEDEFIRRNLKVDTTAIVAVPAGLTLGLVSYLRLAAMATSVFTQLPAWKTLDVAPLISAFDEEEAETIHQIVDE